MSFLKENHNILLLHKFRDRKRKIRWTTEDPSVKVSMHSRTERWYYNEFHCKISRECRRIRTHKQLLFNLVNFCTSFSSCFILVLLGNCQFWFLLTGSAEKLRHLRRRHRVHTNSSTIDKKSAVEWTTADHVRQKRSLSSSSSKSVLRFYCTLLKFCGVNVFFFLHSSVIPFETALSIFHLILLFYSFFTHYSS